MPERECFPGCNMEFEVRREGSDGPVQRWHSRVGPRAGEEQYCIDHNTFSVGYCPNPWHEEVET